MGPNCIFRVDAAPYMGVGHLARCLSLARRLSDQGARVAFVCRDFAGAAIDWVEREGFELFRLPPLPAPANTRDTSSWLACPADEDALQTLGILQRSGVKVDWLVVDHYGIGAAWERAAKAACRRMLVIDDLANRAHDCDLLLDQSLRDGNPYATKVPESCIVLLGPAYALLREEFLLARRGCTVRSGEIRRIVVFFGGSDPTHDTLKTLDALRSAGAGLQADIIVGSMNQACDRIEQACLQTPGCDFHVQVNDMAERLARADLAIGAGGTASWERLALGLPSIVVQQAENQRENVTQLAKCGVVINLGSSDFVDSGHIQVALTSLRSQPERLRKMSELAFGLVDATGAEKVCAAMGH